MFAYRFHGSTLYLQKHFKNAFIFSASTEYLLFCYFFVCAVHIFCHLILIMISFNLSKSYQKQNRIDKQKSTQKTQNCTIKMLIETVNCFGVCSCVQTLLSKFYNERKTNREKSMREACEWGETIITMMKTKKAAANRQNVYSTGANTLLPTMLLSLLCCKNGNDYT